VISATLDSSVYVRALHLGGPSVWLLAHARAGELRLDISDAILSETGRVLRDKFQWDGYMLNDARWKLLSIANRVVPVQSLDIIKEDREDNRILECASTAESDFIVSEDKDLLRLGQYRNIRILRITDMLSILRPD
jgi:putative PIN family toxin of toxin-antitoxin system